MSYVFYNPNPAGKRVGDCVIRAVSKLTGDDWETTYLHIALQGYADFDMPSSNSVWGNYLKSIGFRRFLLSDTCPDRYTVEEFCKDNPKGAYILATGSHVIAVIDGNYYDAWDSGDELPIYYWCRGEMK